MNAVDTELSATVGSKCVRLSDPHNTRLWSASETLIEIADPAHKDVDN